MNIHWMQRDHWPCTNSGLRQMAIELEDIGVCSVLLPYGPGAEDFMVHMPDIFRDTKNIRMMIAVGAYSVTPEYLIRTFDSVQVFGKSRLDLNLVAGRYVEEFENRAIDSYPGDPELVNTHDKRVAITEKWMDKFADLVRKKDYQTRLAVVGTSDITTDIANKHTDYIITTAANMYNKEYTDKITNCSYLLVINPLILQEGQSESDIEYDNTKFALKGGHWPKGNYQEVLQTVKSITSEFSVNDIMIHTDQKDISQIVRLVKELLQDKSNQK
jgi:hypothetical protein